MRIKNELLKCLRNLLFCNLLIGFLDNSEVHVHIHGPRYFTSSSVSLIRTSSFFTSAREEHDQPQHTNRKNI